MSSSTSTHAASRDRIGPFAPAARAYDPDVLETARRWWWLPLIAGTLWTLWGAAILTLRPATILSVAILAGVSFILGGISEFMIAQRVPSWRWLFYLGGVLGIAAGVVAFVWPSITLYVLAIFVSWYLVVAGIFNIVGALAGPKRDWWWAGLVVGVLQLVLGIWALGSTTRQLLLLLNLVGISLIFFGVSEIFAAFSLRSLTEDAVRWREGREGLEAPAAREVP